MDTSKRKFVKDSIDEQGKRAKAESHKAARGDYALSNKSLKTKRAVDSTVKAKKKAFNKYDNLEQQESMSGRDPARMAKKRRKISDELSRERKRAGLYMK